MWLAASSNCQELRPVNMMAREGAHFAFGVYARLKRIPSLANRSNAGVFIHLHPYAPACPKLQSSAIAKRILGLCFMSSP